jgi:hypothetical protein
MLEIYTRADLISAAKTCNYFNKKARKAALRKLRCNIGPIFDYIVRGFKALSIEDRRSRSFIGYGQTRDMADTLLANSDYYTASNDISTATTLLNTIKSIRLSLKEGERAFCNSSSKEGLRLKCQEYIYKNLMYGRSNKLCDLLKRSVHNNSNSVSVVFTNYIDDVKLQILDSNLVVCTVLPSFITDVMKPDLLLAYSNALVLHASPLKVESGFNFYNVITAETTCKSSYSFSTSELYTAMKVLGVKKDSSKNLTVSLLGFTIDGLLSKLTAADC